MTAIASRFLISAMAATALTLAACGGYTAPPSSDNINVKVESRDSAAFYLGQQHGRRFLEEAADTGAMADYLLEVRARETNFRQRIRPSAADAYVAGFCRYVTDHSPELAAEIF